MDPNECMSDVLAAMAEEDFETAAERAGDLLGWLARGGFPPGNALMRSSAVTAFLTSVNNRDFG